MSKVLRHLITIYLAITTLSLSAQDTLPNLQLKEVTISTDRLSIYSAGIKTLRFDEKTLLQNQHRNLADILSDETPVFIKSYGLGGLATTSARGGSAQHTAIVWNGFQLNNAATGQIDLSLVPLSATGSVAVQYGGSCALWGSGAVGGAIHLQSVPQFGTRQLDAHLAVTHGSFSQWIPQLTLKYRSPKLYTSLHLLHHNALNNFQYTNIYLPQQPSFTLTNAALQANAAIYQLHYQPKPRQKWNFAIWWQDNERQIPPTMLQANHRALQHDQSLRVTTEYAHAYTRWKWMVRAAKFIEKIRYIDPQAQIDALSKTLTSIIEAEAKYNISKMHTLHIGSNYTLAIANSENFDDNPLQSRWALFGGYAFRSPSSKWLAHLSARAENVNNVLLPFTFSLGTDYKMSNSITLKAAAAKLFRMPTLNDLYWVPGGNTDLLSETGYSQEVGIHSRFSLPKLHDGKLQIEATAFHRLMEDWIIWLPNSTGNWSPQNIAKVRSSGIETNTSLTHTYHGFTFKYAIMTNYVLSTNQSAKTPNDAAIGKQLIYTPIYSGKAKISLGNKHFSASYAHQYTGYRYTSSDHTQYLEPFQVGSVYLGYQLPFSKYPLSLQLHCFNIWNETYQLLSTRPMPTRNWQVGVKYVFGAWN